MSTVFYRQENSLSTVKNDVKHTVKTSLIDGTKGLSFSFLEKKGDKFYRVSAKQMEDGSFDVKEKKDDKEDKKTMSETDVMKMVKKDKNLNFVDDYVSKERKKYLKGGKRKSKKSSKKSSKRKATKKSSKRKSSKKAKRSSRKKVSKKKASKKKTSKRKSSKKRASRK